MRNEQTQTLYAWVAKDRRRSPYMFISHLFLLQNMEQKGSQGLLSSVLGSEAVIDQGPVFGLFRTAFTKQMQCTRRT